jgi:hypothetical protein
VKKSEERNWSEISIGWTNERGRKILLEQNEKENKVQI